MLSPLKSLLLLSFACVIQTVAGLWPIPRNLQTGTTALRLSPSFAINVNVMNPPTDLMNAVSRAKNAIFSDKLGRLVVGRGANDTQRIQAAKVLSQLNLSITGTRPVKSISTEAAAPVESRSEGYSLTLPADGSAASIKAESTLGLLRGMFLAFVGYVSLYQFFKA